MAKDTFFSKKHTLNCKGKLLNLDKPVVMGILNITPDSFYDGGKYTSDSEIIKQAGKMFVEGAKIVDIGAVSTKPGAQEISEEEEEKRLIPIVKKLVKEFPNEIFSVDTWRSGIAKVAIDQGMSIINDISGGTFDNKMFDLVSKENVPYIIMHIKGKPSYMQEKPVYENLIKELIFFFSKQIEDLKKRGVKDIIIDPGFGFGKNQEHNYHLLKNLGYFHFFGLPIMVGVSRKSMINKLLGTKPANALNGTTVLHTIALLSGAKFLRVHDVKEAVEAIKITEKLNAS